MSSREQEEDYEVVEGGGGEQPQQQAPPPAPPSQPRQPAGGLPSLPPRQQPSGMPSLPPRPTGSSSTPSSSATAATPQQPSQQQQQQQQPSTSMPRLPPRPAGGLPSLPPRQTSASSSQQQQQQPPPSQPLPSAPAGPSGMPSLPPRSAGGAGGAAPPPAPPSRPTLPPRPQPSQQPPPTLAARPTPPPPVAPAAPATPAPPPPAESVVDPTENRKARRTQQRVQELRVTLIRAAGRLGLRYDSEQVTQFMNVINRVETMGGPNVYKGAGRRIDLPRAAEREAKDLDSREPADSKLNLKIKVLLIGMTGTGKSELINSLLERPAAKTNAFTEATKGIRVRKGLMHGIQFEFIDTPGLQAAANKQAENRALLKGIRAAYRWHKPNYVLWVDRLDAVRPSLGDLSLLGLVNEALGAKVWTETMVVLTHAHAAKAMLGPGYDQYSRQRRNIVVQLIKQAAGSAQVRNPVFVADCHPSCPTNSFGQPVILEGASAVPWKQVLVMQLVGYRAFEEVQAMFRSKAAAKAAAAKQDLFKSLMRARLPPVNFYVEQECEGVMKPDTWGSVEDPFDAETDDEEAEEFNHMYYNIMYDLACAGNPWAQKEYSAMLKRINRLRKTFKKAFHAEDVERVVGGGYEGYVAEGLDLGPTFDPEDYTNHRYVYCVPEADIAIMPTLDYYGYEHEDAINGFVAEFDGQPGNRDGWGGFPLNLHLAIEKDKTNMCLQGEGNFSVIHNVQPFGSRHITQVNGAFEMLRPTIKDVLYQLEVNTFKDGVLFANDHAGAGLMMARLGEGGKLDKGPMGMGLRLQETMRIGPFRVDACASKVTTESAGGAGDQAWGARAFVLYDHIPGLGMIFDFYQQRTKEDAPFVGGWASNFTYDFEMLGATCGLELDYIPGQNVLHVDANVFSGKDYKLGWLLLLPAWNLLKGIWQSLRRKPEDEMEMVEEEEEEDDSMGGGGMDAAAMQKMMQQMMAMQGR